MYQASISGKMSSQFLSSLLMASPVVDGDVVIKIKDELISAPYVALTIGLMKKFGVNVEVEGSMDERPTFKIAKSETPIPHQKPCLKTMPPRCYSQQFWATVSTKCAKSTKTDFLEHSFFGFRTFGDAPAKSEK